MYDIPYGSFILREWHDPQYISDVTLVSCCEAGIQSGCKKGKDWSGWILSVALTIPSNASFLSTLERAARFV